MFDEELAEEAAAEPEAALLATDKRWRAWDISGGETTSIGELKFFIEKLNFSNYDWLLVTRRMLAAHECFSCVKDLELISQSETRKNSLNLFVLDKLYIT
jgi:hypothetical protein